MENARRGARLEQGGGLGRSCCLGEKENGVWGPGAEMMERSLQKSIGNIIIGCGDRLDRILDKGWGGQGFKATLVEDVQMPCGQLDVWV